MITPASKNSRPSSARSQTKQEDDRDIEYRNYGNNNSYQSGKIFSSALVDEI